MGGLLESSFERSLSSLNPYIIEAWWHTRNGTKDIRVVFSQDLDQDIPANAIGFGVYVDGFSYILAPPYTYTGPRELTFSSICPTPSTSMWLVFNGPLSPLRCNTLEITSNPHLDIFANQE